MRLPIVLPVALLVVLPSMPPAGRARAEVHWSERDVMADESYLRYHPDQRYRNLGLQAYARQDYASALSYFTEAARYADKASQAFIASMYWEGLGVPPDPATAYAWIDLASERHTPALLAYREHYWTRLDGSQRQRAAAIGLDLYAAYGDDVAQQRLERVMLKGRSRAAATRSPYLYVNGRVEWYQPKFWRPRQYWAFQETLIRDAMPHADGPGQVRVRPLEPLRDPPAGTADPP